MKLLAPFTTLTALATSCVFVKIVSARRLLEPQVVASVSVVGSDAGACLTLLGLKPGCDANYSIVVNKFANGVVRGILQDVFGDGSSVHAKIDCLKITTDVNGVKTAVVSGIVTTSHFPKTSTVLTAVKIDAGGTGYYTYTDPLNDGITCENYNESFDWFEHLNGDFKIEEL